MRAIFAPSRGSAAAGLEDDPMAMMAQHKGNNEELRVMEGEHDQIIDLGKRMHDEINEILKEVDYVIHERQEQ